MDSVSSGSIPQTEAPPPARNNTMDECAFKYLNIHHAYTFPWPSLNEALHFVLERSVKLQERRIRRGFGSTRCFLVSLLEAQLITIN